MAIENSVSNGLSKVLTFSIADYPVYYWVPTPNRLSASSQGVGVIISS